jgi:exodeoxyribonuclease V alpha subunit
METIVGTIKNIVYESQQNDFKVFVLKKKDNSAIRVTGEFSQIMHGAKIEIHGEFKSHPKYGPAFKADAHTFSFENNVTSICLYIQMIAKWVGPLRSYAIAEKFGVDLQEIIEKTPERLMEVEGVGEKVAESIVEAWKLNRDMKDIHIFLHGLGLGVAKIRRISTMFGPNTEQILTDNPWILCGHGFGFTTCDHIAHKLGRDMQDPFRFQQFIMYTLVHVSNSGHLFLYPTQVVEAFNKYNVKADFPFKGGDLTIFDIAPHIKKLIETAYLLNDNNRIYDLSSFFFENESARIISKILNTKSNCRLDPAEAEGFIKRYEESCSVGQSKLFKLSPNQADAVKSFFTEKIMIMTGSPGTGKTQTVKAFVQLLREKGINFELMTPTGIAAKKLGTTTGGEAYTIHRRLGYKGNTWDYNSSNKYATDVIICDELSMVDQEVFYRLISAVYPSTKLVFVGDNDQLPSVGPGCVLKELIDSKLIKTIFLNEIFRQDKCSEIILESKKIRDGDPDLTYFRSEPTSDIWHIVDKDNMRMENTIVKFAQQLKNRAKEKHDITFQIITPRNEGPLSVFSLNTALQNALNPSDPNKKELKVDESTIRVGDRIIIKKNNYEYEVFNGDVGKVIAITPSSVVIDIENFLDSSKRIDLPLKLAEEMIKLAYCLTIHKVQGSEYSIVIIPLIKAHGTMLLQRNLLYTAITRAKKKVILIGQTSAIEQAIKNDKIQKRNTVLAERVNKWMSGTGISMRSMFSQSGISLSNETLERLLSLEEGLS